MSPIEPPSAWNPVPAMEPLAVPEIDTPDVNKVTAEAMYAALAQPAHPVIPPSNLAPLPDESLTRLSQEKGSAAGEVMHVLAGSDSGSIENLVNQALANRPPRQGPPPSPEERARLAKQVRVLARGWDEDSEDSENSDSVRSILRAGARVLRRVPLQLRRALRG